jgi:uncharacterized membrane protein YfcA
MESIYLATFVVAFVSSILSGIAGGGGGFIMAPYWLISGMTPAQGATTGAFMALGMGGSSLAAFRGTGHMPRNKKLMIMLLVMTLLTSAVGPFFLQHIHVDVFKPILAMLTIISLPLLFINRKDIHISKQNQAIGIALLGILLLASSFITSSAFSIFIAIVLSQVFSLSVLQSTALRRLIGIVQSAVIFGILVCLGNFLWPHALAGIIGGSIGSYIGTKLAIKRGEKFAKYALAIGATISSLALFV